MAANLENSAVATRLEKVNFRSNPKKGNAKECSNYRTIAFISQASKVMRKILQARLQQYMTVNFEMFKLDLEKAEEPESNCQHQLDHQKTKRVPEKHLLLLYGLTKAFECVDHSKLWKIFKEMRIPDYLTCLLRNLYAGKEATEPDMEQQTGSKLGKEYVKAYIVTLLI